MLTQPKYLIYTVKKKAVETLSQVLALESNFQNADHVLCMNLFRETPTLMDEHKQGKNKDL